MLFNVKYFFFRYSHKRTFYKKVKRKTQYICQSCGSVFSKWSGQCSACNEWNTLKEYEKEKTTFPSQKGGGKIITFTREAQKEENNTRFSTKIYEVDRTLGGGILSGSIVLLTGSPGIGKSTLSLQITQNIAQEYQDEEIFLFSGEESENQVSQRLKRLGKVCSNIKIANTYFVEDIFETAKVKKPKLIVVDSVQTFVSGAEIGNPGSPSQIRAVTEILMNLAKTENISVLLIGQVTKEGSMAGPQLLAHLVDVTLHFEGDEQHELRILRCDKNRFGATSEIGIFEMTNTGLQELKNPSSAFLSGRLPGASGSVIFPALEGKRPFLVEIQALTSNTPFGLPKRNASGIPLNRLSLLIAVLEKHAGVNLSSQDVFANVIGGFSMKETAADLAICLSLTSSRLNIAVPEKMVALGEVGLSGEVRSIPHLEKRLQEAEKLGFTIAFIPKTEKKITSKMKLIPVQTVRDVTGTLQRGEIYTKNTK